MGEAGVPLPYFGVLFTSPCECSSCPGSPIHQGMALGQCRLHGGAL